jgi:hypothetical protein
MRLGQLARKLSIRQLEIVSFLAKSNVEVNNESNVKLEEEHVQLVIQHFAPAFLDSQVAIETFVPELATPVEISQVIVEDIKIELVEIIPVVKELKPVVELMQVEIIEVIKAPKVDLPGLKVLGKIDLPQPKLKEEASLEKGEVEEPKSTTEIKSEERAQRTQNGKQERNERVSRPAINTIALQRDRDARAAEEKRKVDNRNEKERRTEYYHKKVKPNITTKASRIFTEPVEEYTSPIKEKPTTLFGKIMDWFTNA